MRSSGLSVPERLALSGARGISRRRLVRNVGGVALGTAISSAYLGRRSDIAEAFCEVPKNRCGPIAESPVCGSFRCGNNQPSHCDAGRADTAWRRYNNYYCPREFGGCWTNVYSGTRYECCDCAGCAAPCGQSVSGCGSCSGTWRACICVGTCAQSSTC